MKSRNPRHKKSLNTHTSAAILAGSSFAMLNPIRSRESTYSRFNSPAGWKNHGFLLPCNGFSPLSLASAELQFTLVAVFVSLMF